MRKRLGNFSFTTFNALHLGPLNSGSDAGSLNNFFLYELFFHVNFVKVSTTINLVVP